MQNDKLKIPALFVFAREQSDRSNPQLQQFLKLGIATPSARNDTLFHFLHFTLHFDF